MIKKMWADSWINQGGKDNSGDQEILFPIREGVFWDRSMFPKGRRAEGNIDSVEGHSRCYEGMNFLGRGKTREIHGYPPNFLLVIDIV